MAIINKIIEGDLIEARRIMEELKKNPREVEETNAYLQDIFDRFKEKYLDLLEDDEEEKNE